MYIKGATAEPWDKIINPPNKNITMMTGNNQYFFLAVKKDINSFKNSIKIGSSL